MKRILFLLAFLPTILQAQPYIFNTGSNQQIINHSSFYDFKTGVKLPRMDSGKWYPGYYSDIFISKADSTLQFYDPKTGISSPIIGTNCITPEMYGAKGDGVTDDGAAINKAISVSNSKPVFMSGNYYTSETITPIQGANIVLTGTLKSSQNPIIELSDKSNISWSGGEIIGDSTVASQQGFLMINSSNNKISNLKISFVPNKGISVGADADSLEYSQNNRLTNLTIRKSNSSSGAGISLFGNGCIYNTIENVECYDNRIGITLNGAHYNTIKNPYCHDNWQMGLTMDGIVSLSGDGGKYNTIIAPVCNNNGDAGHTTYGGIYLGNGSSYNNIISPICKGNSGAGIRLTSSTTFNNIGNTITNFLCDSNGVNGITVSGSGKTFIANGTSKNNTGRGIAIFASDDCQISNVKALNNTTQGVIVQSLNCIMTALNTSGNSVGVRVATGGSAVGDGNVLANSNIRDSISSDNNLLHIYNETGSPNVVQADAGDANYTFLTQNAKVVVYNTPITNTRTVSLSTTGAKNGDHAKVIRTALATGAFNINVGSPTIKALSAGEYVDLVFDGTAWVQTGFGSLALSNKYILNQTGSQTGNINLDGNLVVTGATTTLESDVVMQNSAFRSLQLYRPVNTINTGNPLRFYNDDAGATKTLTGQILGALSSNTAGTPKSYLAFQTNTDGTSTEKLRISSAGNILVGTTTDPTGSSNIAATGSIFAGGSLITNTNTILPTHSITVPSVGTGYTLYNTVDQTTNYERLTISKGSSIFNIVSENGGTGVLRPIKIGVGTRFINITNAASASGILNFDMGSTSSAGTGIGNIGTMSGTAGTQNFVGFFPTISQSSTAGYSVIYASPRITSTGSSPHFLINVGTNTGAANSGTHTPFFTVTDTGKLNIKTDTYADNAAALAGGLVVGDVYKTSTGILMVVF